MAKEIERKFLVVDDSYKDYTSTRIRQGYLSSEPSRTVRVRVKDNRGYLTVKGLTCGATRDEFEYEIPLCDAEAMLCMCDPDTVIDKIRYNVGRWEVDEFHGRLEGLRVAEIELSVENEAIALPSFAGREVTGDERYYNSALASATKLPPLK